MRWLTLGFLWRWCLARPRRVVALAALALLCFAVEARHLRLEPHIDLLSPDDPVSLSEKRRHESFGADLRVVVALCKPHAEGGVVRSTAFEALRDLHDKARAVAGVRRVSSLVNATALVGSDAAKPGGPVWAGFESGGPLSAVERLNASELEKQMLLSPLWTLTPLYFELDPDVSETQIVQELRRAALEVERNHPDAGRVLVVGPAVVETGLATHIFEDLYTLIPLAVAVVAVCLYLVVRRAILLLIAVIHCGLLIAVVLGGMALLGLTVNLVSVLAPVILIPIGLSDLLHLFVRLESGAESSGGSTGGADVLESTFADLEWPMVATSAANALGFLGFYISPVQAIRQFGLTISAGVIVALIIGFTIDVALLRLFWRPETTHSMPDRKRERIERWLLAVVGNPRSLKWSAAISVLVCVALAVASLWAARGLHIEDTWVQNFDPASRVRQDTEQFETHFLGTNLLALVVTPDADQPGSRAAAVRAVNEMTTTFGFTTGIKGALSATLLARSLDAAQGKPWLPWPAPSVEGLADALRDWDRRGLPLPRSHMLASADLDKFQVLLFVLNQPYSHLENLVEQVRLRGREILGPEAELTVGGDLVANIEMVRQAVLGQASSQVVEFLVIAGLAMLFTRSLLGGAVLVAPMVLAILITYALLVIVGLPYGIAVSMFPTLAVGTAIEFSIHIRAALMRNRLSARAGSVRDLAIVIQGVLLNGFLWTAGFAILALSRLPPNRFLGLVCSTVFALSTAATLLLIPAAQLVALRKS